MGTADTDTVRRYFELLEIQPGSSRDDVTRARRDMAQIWHPDRFLHLPDLRTKVEERLKQINEAADFLTVHWHAYTDGSFAETEAEGLRAQLRKAKQEAGSQRKARNEAERRADVAERARVEAERLAQEASVAHFEAEQRADAASQAAQSSTELAARRQTELESTRHHLKDTTATLRDVQQQMERALRARSEARQSQILADERACKLGEELAQAVRAERHWSELARNLADEKARSEAARYRMLSIASAVVLAMVAILVLARRIGWYPLVLTAATAAAATVSYFLLRGRLASTR